MEQNVFFFFWKSSSRIALVSLQCYVNKERYYRFDDRPRARSVKTAFPVNGKRIVRIHNVKRSRSVGGVLNRYVNNARIKRATLPMIMRERKEYLNVVFLRLRQKVMTTRMPFIRRVVSLKKFTTISSSSCRDLIRARLTASRPVSSPCARRESQRRRRYLFLKPRNAIGFENTVSSPEFDGRSVLYSTTTVVVNAAPQRRISSGTSIRVKRV